MEDQKPRPGWDGKMYFEILEIIPNKKISYSFKGGPNPNEMNLNTIINWHFAETESGTTITLNHTGFEGFRGAVTRFIMEKGWGKIIGKRLRLFLEAR